MNLLRGFAVAFAMYSRIPMPRVDWTKESMRYAMCFFPFIGVVIGAAELGWLWLAWSLNLGAVLRGAVAALLPLIITGGIHMDGFCDTLDALSSRQPMERKLEILKDSNSGAFAVMGCVGYLLLFAALWAEPGLSWRAAQITALGFVLSRALSGIAVVTFHCARGHSGMLAAFADGAQKDGVRAVLLAIFAICVFAMMSLSLVMGGVCALVSIAVFIYYRVMSYRQFGGITGDLAGYFLTLCELCILLAAVLTEVLIK